MLRTTMPLVTLVLGLVLGCVFSRMIIALCSFFLIGDVIGIGAAGIGNRAIMAIRSGDYEEAVAWSNKLIAKDPELPEGYVFRGRANELAGRTSLAIGDYSVAIAYSSTPACYYADRANAFFKAGMPFEAAQDYARLTIDAAESPARREKTLEIFLSREYMMGSCGPRTGTSLLEFLEGLDADIRKSPLVARAIEILRRPTRRD